jgi:ABC-type nitrate/sulfonate/bicarbonate transport system permease component
MKAKKQKLTKIIQPILCLALLLIIWEAATRARGIPLYILPAPSKIIGAFILDFATLLLHASVTLIETVIGLLIATGAGVVIAIVMDAFGLVRNMIYPLLVVSQTVPVIVLAPIFIIYLGFGLAPKILTVVLMCFFPIVISLADGMSQADIRQVNLVKSFGANPLQVYFAVKIPAAATSLFSGLKVAATYSISGAVVGEWLSSDSGLGYYMLRVKNGYMLDKVFATILTVVLLSLMMNGWVKLLKYIALPHLRKRYDE